MPCIKWRRWVEGLKGVFYVRKRYGVRGWTEFDEADGTSFLVGLRGCCCVTGVCGQRLKFVRTLKCETSDAKQQERGRGTERGRGSLNLRPFHTRVVLLPDVVLSCVKDSKARKAVQ